MINTKLTCITFNRSSLILLFFILLQFLCNCGIAQNKNTDSLLQKLRKAKTEKDKLIFYCDLGWEWYAMNADTAIYYAAKGFQQSTEQGNKKELACNCNVLGLAYFRKRMDKKSIEYYLKGIELYKQLGDKKDVARLSSNIADVYMSKDNYDAALQYSLSGVQQAEKDNDSILISSIHRSVSIIYRNMENYKKAEEYILKSLDFAGAGSNNTKGKAPLGAAYSSYGILLRTMKQYDKSIVFAKKSIEAYHNAGDDYNVALGMENLAGAYFDKKQIKNALQYYNEAMQQFIKMKSPIDEAYELNNIAACENELKQYAGALTHLEKARNIFTENKTDNYLMETESLLSETYQSLGNTVKAFEAYKKNIAIKDTIKSQEQRNKLMQLQTEYEAAENEKKIDDLKNEKLLQDERLKRNSIVTLIMAAVIALMIFTGFILRNRYKLKQKLKEEEIRNKIASDLHDDVGSTLSSIRMYSGIVKEQVKQNHPQSSALLDKISSNSKEMIENMSDIVWMIKPGNDEFKNIESRMLNFANELCSPSGINFEFSKDNAIENIKMPMEQRRDIYLIFKEAVNNAVKYSGCKNIRSTISFQNHQLQILIADDGKGFDIDAVKNGNGLSNMEKRTAAYKGSFVVQSAPGEGTEIIVVFGV
ncbi:MAG: tetratricopeptide repeat protein [Ginsengibacter sp.]